MQIEVLPLGYLEANCYILTKNNKSIIIDPGDEFSKISKFCESKHMVGILVTHDHFDHVGALKDCEEYYHLKSNPNYIEGFQYQVIKNPGHSKDSISFYFREENILFAGDFIFQRSIGRCDLEGGNFLEMQKSIQNILTFPSDMLIYPGHGPETTLEKEKNYLQEILKY